MILEMLFILRLGDSLARADLSSPGFLSNGVTDGYADLKAAGNWPWLKERLASIVISSENVEQQDLRRLVGDKVHRRGLIRTIREELENLIKSINRTIKSANIWSQCEYRVLIA